MEFYKSRVESEELKILRMLDSRMKLEEVDKQHYHNLEKGFEGEVRFDSLTKELQCQGLILNDLLLETGGSKFQIDSLMITSELLHLFEIKNFEGDFYYDSHKFYTIHKKEIKNPLLQLERCESLLRQLLQQLGYRIPIEASVIFINPEFHLYQSPLNQPIIYPNQLKLFMKKLDMQQASLKDRQLRLADLLLSRHQADVSRERLPPYRYNLMRNGMNCEKCYSFEVVATDYHLNCNDCGHIEKIDHALVRHINAFILLFPNEKITTNVIYDWVQVVHSRKTILRVLKRYYASCGKTKGSFYEKEMNKEL